MATDTQQTVDHLNGLLRGEISAAETYKMAIDRIGDDAADRPQVESLHSLQRDHGAAAQRIRGRIHALGGAADNDSGAWGVWAQFVQKTANLLGDKSALKALKEGEEHGLKDYERTLDDDLDPQSRALVQELLAQQRAHIAAIDRLIATA